MIHLLRQVFIVLNLMLDFSFISCIFLHNLNFADVSLILANYFSLHGTEDKKNRKCLVIFFFFFFFFSFFDEQVNNGVNSEWHLQVICISRFSLIREVFLYALSNIVYAYSFILDYFCFATRFLSRRMTWQKSFHTYVYKWRIASCRDKKKK